MRNLKVFISVVLLLYVNTNPVFSQIDKIIQENRDLNDEELAQIVKEHLIELSQRKYPTTEEYYGNRIETIDSLLEQDSTNLSLWNKRVSLNLILKNYDEAKKDFTHLSDLTNDDPKYFFVRAAFHDGMREFELADSLYKEYVSFLEYELQGAKTKDQEAEYLLSLWYVFEYLGEEEKSKGLIRQLYNEYYEWIAVGIDPYYFGKRFGDAIFDQE